MVPHSPGTPDIRHVALRLDPFEGEDYRFLRVSTSLETLVPQRILGKSSECSEGSEVEWPFTGITNLRTLSNLRILSNLFPIAMAILYFSCLLIPLVSMEARILPNGNLIAQKAHLLFTEGVLFVRFCTDSLKRGLFREFKHPWIHSLCHVPYGIYGPCLRAVDILQWNTIQVMIFNEI